MAETLTVYRCPRHGLVKFAGAGDRCLMATRHGRCSEVCSTVEVAPAPASSESEERHG